LLVRRWQADGRFLREQRVDVTRQLLGALPSARLRTNGLLCFSVDVGIVAFDERLRLQVLADVRIGRTRLKTLRIGQLDRRAAYRLPRSLEIGVRQVGAIELETKEANVARLVDALPHRGNNGGRLQKI